MKYLIFVSLLCNTVFAQEVFETSNQEKTEPYFQNASISIVSQSYISEAKSIINNSIEKPVSIGSEIFTTKNIEPTIPYNDLRISPNSEEEIESKIFPEINAQTPEIIESLIEPVTETKVVEPIKYKHGKNGIDIISSSDKETIVVNTFKAKPSIKNEIAKIILDYYIDNENVINQTVTFKGKDATVTGKYVVDKKDSLTSVNFVYEKVEWNTGLVEVSE